MRYYRHQGERSGERFFLVTFSLAHPHTMINIDPPSTDSNSITRSKPALTRFLHRAQKVVGLAGEVDVLLTSDEEIRRLNRTFRKKNKATDVLSFPAPEELAEEHAGDLAISLDAAARQAESFGHSLNDEVKILLLHGLLHLAGMDHEIDSGEMASREAELRAELKLPVTLIERTITPRSRPRSASLSRRSSR